jgi:hypothetical protein
MLLALSIYALYLAAGWLALTRGIKYSLPELRREIESNGVDCPTGDRLFDFFLASAYVFVLNIWPVAVHRKIRQGRVVGK